MMIISSQSLNNIPPIIRGQVRDLIVTRQQNQKELDKISILQTKKKYTSVDTK